MWNFFGECKNVFGKCLKKVVEKFRQKFDPPVSEGLDPLVSTTEPIELETASDRCTSTAQVVRFGVLCWFKPT